MKDARLFPEKQVLHRKDRLQTMGQKPLLIWFTGLSASGKSTIAGLLEKSLQEQGVKTYLLDGDHVRGGLCKDLGFSEADRKENIRRVAEVCKLMCDAGLVVLTAFISPFRSDREAVRSSMQSGEYFEVFVNTPLEICEARDPKGLYKRARAGAINNFTGISQPYEIPLSPELEVLTAENDAEACAAQVFSQVIHRIRI